MQIPLVLAGRVKIRTRKSRMQNPKDVKSVEPELLDLEYADTDEPTAGDWQPTGRIVHDERGNALWKWRGDTSSSDDTTASGVLKYIDPMDLKVEGQPDEPASSNRNVPKVRDAGGGYDPYNQDVARGKANKPGNGGRGKV
jgi:hypothetical protein